MLCNTWLSLHGVWKLHKKVPITLVSLLNYVARFARNLVKWDILWWFCKHCELQEFIDVLENKSQWIFNYVSTIRDMQILINSVSVSRALRILFLPKVFHCREELILARARHWLIYRLLKLTWLNQIHCYTVLQEILLHKKEDAPSFFRASCASPCLPLSCCSSRLK